MMRKSVKKPGASRATVQWQSRRRHAAGCEADGAVWNWMAAPARQWALNFRGACCPLPLAEVREVHGGYELYVALPEGVRAGKIRAACKDGVLRLKVPVPRKGGVPGGTEVKVS